MGVIVGLKAHNYIKIEPLQQVILNQQKEHLKNQGNRDKKVLEIWLLEEKFPHCKATREDLWRIHCIS